MQGDNFHLMNNSVELSWKTNQTDNQVYKLFHFTADDRFHMDVTNKIPVELNCLLLKTVEIIVSWHEVLENIENKKFWNDIARKIATAIDEVSIFIVQISA